jgi:hypothetical protein
MLNMARTLAAAILTAVVCFATLTRTGLGGPVTTASVVHDLVCETLLAGTARGGRSVRWTASPSSSSPPKDARPSAWLSWQSGEDACAADAQPRLLRHAGVRGYGAQAGWVQAALAIAAGGHVGTLLVPRLVWVWVVGLLLLPLALNGVGALELGYWGSVLAAVATLLTQGM